MFWAYAILTWLGLAALAVGLGALRVLLLQPLAGEGVAHVLGTLAGCALFLGVIHWFVGRFFPRADLRSPRTRVRLALLGLFWTILTIAFEFGFGRYVRGLSWQILLADYNLLAGRLWVLVLLTLYFGPRLAAWAIARRKR
ncbi:MAG: hypothetical protein KKA55_08620 [Proteobacteria bacterium]|nr:hypothetical protein [Pseudomonadota bacterium]MBU1595580.1 hypothetical protein [Pseudomonadota bacterium]